MSEVLSIEDTKKLLQWALEIEMTKIHPASGDSESYKFMDEQNETFNTSMSCFIWRLLGHKDKGMRCKAAHVLLLSSLLGNVKMVEQISNLYHSELPQAYMDENNYFFIESAKLAFIARENIDELVSEMKKPYTSFYDFCYQEDEWRNRKKSKVIIYPTCDVITTFPDYALDKKDLLLKDYLNTSIT